MPSGKVHDVITIGLAVPVAFAAFSYAGGWMEPIVMGSAFVFGGLMFGPDLDTISRPYTRWGPARVIWLPYRHFFPHRSRFSHGLLLGALLRVIYLLGCLSILLLIVGVTFNAIAGGRFPAISDISNFWRRIGGGFGAEMLLMIFLGLWAGAASHTLTDVAGSFIKTGRAGKVF